MTHTEGNISNNIIFYEDILKSPERTRYVRNMFSKITPRYDLLNRIMSLGLDLYWRRLAITKANFAAGSRILDLGIGTGDMGREALHNIKRSRVFGIDNCFELVDYGRKKKIEKNSSNNSLHWTIGDGRQLSFHDCTFDGVVAAFSIRNIPDLPVVFSEIYRIIKPGGKVVILDMVKPNGYLSNKIFNFHFKYIVPRLGQWLGSDPEAYSYLLPSIENFYSSKQLKAELDSRGYNNIFLKDLMFSTVTICIGTK